LRRIAQREAQLTSWEISVKKLPPEILKKLHPKLRMITDGDSVVNAIRAERCAGLSVSSEALLRRVPEMRAEDDRGTAVEKAKKKPQAGRLQSVPTDILTNVFVHFRERPQRTKRLKGEFARQGRVAQVQASLSTVRQLASEPEVAFIELGEALKPPVPLVSDVEPGPPPIRTFPEAAKHRYGEGVLMGVIDVDGFDFAHADFLKNGKTRFVRIWDQGNDDGRRPRGKQFAYGSELTSKDFRTALDVSKQLGFPATEITRQSQQVEGSHGTHVASICAGNRGVCRNAMIAGVVISLPKEDTDRRKSFYDSTRLSDAIDYLLDVADDVDAKAVSINISLGTNGHAHDGSAAVNRWMDAALATSGRCITVAAGNAGQERAETADDLGWVVGRIHSSGRIPAAKLEVDLEWVVVGDGTLDISENEMEIWFSPQDTVTVAVKPPNGEWTEEIEPRQYIENRILPTGTVLSIYNEVYHPANGANYVSVYLSPFFSQTEVIGVAAGTWTIRLRGHEIRDGRFHAWIERDDPKRLGIVDDAEVWAFPSFFSPRSLVDDSTVSSLGCGNRVITVANLDVVRNRINISSSQGPTRDGRFKPDIAAVGTDVVAANGFAGPDRPWRALTGTSMASPFVAGVAGLMLAAEPRLTSAQIEAIVRRTARPLPGATYDWVNDAGFGVIDADACITEATRLFIRKDLT
jgi:subtilisin family serine protease